MPAFLRTLGVLVLALGTVVGVTAGWLVAGDSRFREVAAAYSRHPEHPLFQGEYWAAAARHYGLLAAAVGGLVAGLSLGAMLLGLAELLRRVPRRDL
jgi:hypothetical protein